MRDFDAIVIGLGAMGSAALHHLAARGLRVLGIEQFGAGHDLGSSHGQTRIIRKAYFEHPDYVPLLHTAYRLWDALEREAGTTLVHRCGLLLAGHDRGEVISGVRRSAREHGLDVRDVARDEFARRFPGFVLGDGMTALHEPDAGYIEVEKAVRAQIECAKRRGATVLLDTPVVSCEVRGRTVVVATKCDSFETGRVVVTCGAWASRVLKMFATSPLGEQKPLIEISGTSEASSARKRDSSAAAVKPLLKSSGTSNPFAAGEDGNATALRPVRKVQLWFPCDAASYRVESGSPVFCYDTPGGFFYGFPQVSPGEVKVAEHSGGEPVSDPSHLDRALHERDIEGVSSFLSSFMPAVKTRPARHSVCMYTMTPDQHFVIDRLSSEPSIAVAAGFSGHGFKFAPAVGSILADLVCDGATREPIGFLSASRPALRIASGGLR